MLLFSLVLINICLIIVHAQQFGLPQDNNRIYSGITDIGLNLIAQVNNSFVFPLVTKQKDRVNLWLLARQTLQSYQTSDPNYIDSLPIYYPSITRASNLSGTFNCLPNEYDCQQIRIPNFDTTQVGLYTFRYDSDNFLSSTRFQFNVSALASQIKLDCAGQNSSCLINTTTNTISILADQLVTISCAIDVVQNDDYPLSAQFKIMSDSYELCSGDNSSLTRINSSIINKSNYNQLFSRLNKTCSTKFSVQDSNKQFSCFLNPTQNSSPQAAMFQQTQTFQTLSIGLDVHYGPDPTLPLNPIPFSYQYLFNKTIMLGTQTNFTCPFNGNPTPNYYWRIVNSSVSVSNNNSSIGQSTDFSLSSQDFTISRNLQVGTYTFECKAQVLGLVNNYSQTIQFSLTIIPPPTPVVKNDNGTNVGAVVGGVIGGIALLIIIIVIVLMFVLYGRKKRNSKDEIEKAKDNKKSKKKPETNIEKQDIDIDIRPPESYGDDVDDDGGFNSIPPNELNNEDTSRIPPPLPKTLPPSESSSSLRQYNDLNENSSLANNKLAPWHTTSSNSNFSNRQFQQLPILNLNTNLNNQTPPTPKKRLNNNTNNEVDVNNNIENITLSSTSLSVRQNDERKPSTYKNLNDITTSATEFFHSTNMGSSNGLNLIHDPSNSTNNYGVYSPSNAEARYLEATSATDSNLSLAAKQTNKQQHQLFSNNNNYSTSNNNTINATTSNAQQLSIPKGAIKVLPTSTAPLKKINPNPLESPPPYESALHQPMNLKKESPIEQQRLNQQQKDYMGSNSRLISEQNTPTQTKHVISQSYTATPQHLTTNSITNTPSHVSSALQQLGYQNQSNIQYTSVHNLGARSRNPLNGLPNEMEQQTQYSTIAAQLSSNPIDV